MKNRKDLYQYLETNEEAKKIKKHIQTTGELPAEADINPVLEAFFKNK